MRLLSTQKVHVQDFSPNKIPAYAVLSHTWGDEEVTFQDMERNTYEHKSGFPKIQDFCKRAANDGYEWVWVDTCCIDKTSSAELSEAINSMYKWYRDAAVCYAYLEDLESLECMRECRWFSRGWTLQELIAPHSVIFFDAKWQEVGTRNRLVEEISSVTGIPEKILLGDSPFYCNIAQRMSWASNRETTREEDIAYCLMGLFDISMVPIYGEGSENAFLRLQQEILQRNADQTILLWTPYHDRGNVGLLATSPKAFCTHRSCFGWLHWVEDSAWLDTSEKFDPYSALLPDRFKPSKLTFNKDGKEAKGENKEEVTSNGLLGPQGLQISLLATPETPCRIWEDGQVSKLIGFDIMACGRLDRCRIYLQLYSEQRNQYTRGFTPNRLGNWIRNPLPMTPSEYLLHPLSHTSFQRERISISQINTSESIQGSPALFTLRNLGPAQLIGNVGVVRETEYIDLVPYSSSRFECTGGVIQLRHECAACDNKFALFLMFGTRRRNMLPWCYHFRNRREPTSMIMHHDSYRQMALISARLQEHSRYVFHCGKRARAKIEAVGEGGEDFCITVSVEG